MILVRYIIIPVIIITDGKIYRKEGFERESDCTKICHNSNTKEEKEEEGEEEESQKEARGDITRKKENSRKQKRPIKEPRKYTNGT